MAKREITEDEQQSIKAIFDELAGYTVEQAEAILKAVAAQIKERAVIE